MGFKLKGRLSIKQRLKGRERVMRSLKLAERFLQKADQDMLVSRKWWDVGFHAQQAKALLAWD